MMAQLVSDLSEYVKKHYVDAQDGTIGEALKHFMAQLVSDLSEYVKKHYVDAQDSTIGEALKHFKAQLVSDLSEYVKKHYVDAQDSTISEALKHFKAQLVSDLSEYTKKHYVDSQDGTISEALKHFKAQLVSDLSEYAKKDYVDAQDGTIGEILRHFIAQLVSDLSEYTKKDYVDAQDGTISEALKHFKTQLVSDISEYAKKDYVDAQDDLRVLKTGDTIVSNPLITVWAENKRSMLDKRYELSFGSDAARGYAMGATHVAAGRFLRMGLSTTAPHNGVSDASVNISVNGIENKSYGATRLTGQISGVSIFETPLELVQGDTINFKSVTDNPKISGATVSLLIELDLLIPFFKQPPKMSITGDRIHRGPDTAGDYAKKDYVDEQLALRVLKTATP